MTKAILVLDYLLQCDETNIKTQDSYDMTKAFMDTYEGEWSNEECALIGDLVDRIVNSWNRRENK